MLAPLSLGELNLRNRIVMAPMTRSRALAGDLPGELAVQYYGERSSAGLIVSEGTQPCPDGKGYCRTPGIHNAAQVAAWQAVTAAVHAGGGAMVAQLMHCGRIGSHYNKDPGARTVAPSALRAAGRMFTDTAGMVDFDMPQELGLSEIPQVIGEFAGAARAARAAGFDGVELHAASGYLPMQFLSTGTNRRSDAYGGSVTARVRFVVEVLEALVAAVGAGRVGMRICPGNPFNDLSDADPRTTYATLLDAAAPLRLAYLHVIRSPDAALDAFALARAHFAGPLILNDGFDFTTAEAAVRSGEAAAVSFARAYIANPDLVARYRQGWPLAQFDRKTLYTAGAAGYTSYGPYCGP
ncbi:MAG: alkene reductase [Proteobacteria bacterium]|nr:alkene reductase [Pseudomonadota bacterium]